MTIQLNKTKAFLDRVLEKVPEAEREALRAEYSGAHDEATAIERDLAAGIARVNTTHAKQTKWWTDHGIDPATGEPKVPPVNPVAQAVDGAKITKDLQAEIATTRETLAGQGMYLASVIPTLIAQHGVEFAGEVLDGEKLVADCLKDPQQRDLKAFYADSVKEKRATKAAAKSAADIAAAEERGRLKGLSEAGGHPMPFPGGKTPGRTLDGLRAPDPAKTNDYTLDAAVATANEVLAKQATG